MDLNDYTGGYTIGSAYITDVCDAFNGDTLHIDADPGDPAGLRATFRYTNNTGSATRYSWRSATGAYDPRLGIITGTIDIMPPGEGRRVPVQGWFSIALDRNRPPPGEKRWIHVFVKGNFGGAPDEGSFTGQGN